MSTETAANIRACDVLQGAIDLLGPNGEKWTKGSFRRWGFDSETGHQYRQFCLLGAIREASGYYNGDWMTNDQINAMQEAERYVGKVLNETTRWTHSPPDEPASYVPDFNDDPHTHFNGVKRLLNRALQNCILTAKGFK